MVWTDPRAVSQSHHSARGEGAGGQCVSLPACYVSFFEMWVVLVWCDSGSVGVGRSSPRSLQLAFLAAPCFQFGLLGGGLLPVRPAGEPSNCRHSFGLQFGFGFVNVHSFCPQFVFCRCCFNLKPNQVLCCVGCKSQRAAGVYHFLLRIWHAGWI